ncbi:hypothetical protein J4N45_22245 [Vibrio sp. SCSIO 43140]|uniref:hypothetical protein n=1 Tax=Vibrio sp. SCSIO 43140 TaxID=2819100 RepID=UPI00207523A9|nr:hypothetical protein [Vibrio sp. SCSIO 43140]USD63693.1 hypothetical protein J4N45_22245 [Vibrio sp. SCSIO 43140]
MKKLIVLTVALATSAAVFAKSVEVLNLETKKDEAPPLTITTKGDAGGSKIIVTGVYKQDGLVQKAPLDLNEVKDFVNRWNPTVRFDLSKADGSGQKGFIILDINDCKVKFYNPDGTLKGEAGQGCY